MDHEEISKMKPADTLISEAGFMPSRCFFCCRRRRSDSHRYLKGWFFVDAVSSLPVALVVHYVDVSGMGGYFYTLKLVS